MRIYLQALDYEIWEIVNDGSFMPLTKNEVGEDIPKPSRDWNEFEKRKASLNSKAMNALFCALDKKEFHRVSSCESANEIWHKLEVVYEGTNQVKESKISRFTDIVNTLGALGKTFSNSEKVKKIIKSLPKKWRPKRTAIEEAKDLNVLPIDDLIGSLISYEEDLTAEKGHEEKKKNIALKASKRESDEENEMDDAELAMLARRFRKFYKKNNEQRKFRGYKNKNEKKEPITYYECKKPGHIRPECPLLNKLKKKAMVATWDDSDEETSDDDEQQEMTNLALMAVGEESCDELDEGSKKKKNKWYLDSGCSRHMTGNYSWFSSFTKIENGGDVSFEDNSKGKIIGIGNGNVANKDDAIDAFRIFYKKVQNEKCYSITCIRSDHGGEFAFENFCNNFGIEHQFSSPRTPQQNGVVERKNRSIQEMARTMLNENSLPKYFWAEAVNTACYVLNRVLIRPNLNKTSYELWKYRKPNIGYFKVFGCKCFVLNTKDNLGKFDPKSDVGIFLDYSNSSKAYRVYNKRTLVVEESMHVTFDETKPSSTEKVIVDDNAEEEQQQEASNDNQEDAPPVIQEEHHEKPNAEQNEGTSQTLPKEWRYVSSYPKDVILGDPSRGVTTRSSLRNTYFSSCMSQEFEMSMKRESKYFLGLQIKQNEEGIFINQAKYVKDLLKRFGYDNGTVKSTPMSTTIKLDKDEKGKEVDIKTYRGSSDDGLDIFSLRKPPDIDDYVHVDAVRNICWRSDLSVEDCTIYFHTQCLCLQTRFLLRIIQSIVLPRSGHLNEVSHMDVAMIDCILRGRPIDLGYSIIRTMLSIPALITRSLPYGHFITRILKFFEVPILEPSYRPSKGIGDEVIVGLGFEWKDDTWVKYSDNKFTFLAPSDDRPLNAVIPADQLPVFSLSFRGQRRRRVSSTVALAPSASASVSSPPRPPIFRDVTL
ncbi:hypothetical protein KPL70_017899 [Citrus sinensis]|nr:hypothetical protein KPL70_017899 [Citrus sinensis]